jgi:hypothetical protein
MTIATRATKNANHQNQNSIDETEQSQPQHPEEGLIIDSNDREQEETIQHSVMTPSVIEASWEKHHHHHHLDKDEGEEEEEEDDKAPMTIMNMMEDVEGIIYVEEEEGDEAEGGNIHDVAISTPRIDSHHYVRAIADYITTEENELCLTQNELLIVDDMGENGWWLGRNNCGKSGWFPCTYVEWIECLESPRSIEPPPTTRPEPIQTDHVVPIPTLRGLVRALYDFDNMTATTGETYDDVNPHDGHDSSNRGRNSVNDNEWDAGQPLILSFRAQDVLVVHEISTASGWWKGQMLLRDNDTTAAGATSSSSSMSLQEKNIHSMHPCMTDPMQRRTTGGYDPNPNAVPPTLIQRKTPLGWFPASYVEWVPVVQVVWDYEKSHAQELNLVAGEYISVLRSSMDSDSIWWEGFSASSGLCGWFPRTHVDADAFEAAVYSTFNEDHTEARLLSDEDNADSDGEGEERKSAVGKASSVSDEEYVVVLDQTLMNMDDIII